MDLTTQYISDNQGNTVPKWHLQALKERLESYNRGEDPESDLDEFMASMNSQD